MHPSFASWWQRHQDSCNPAHRPWFGGGCGTPEGANETGPFDPSSGFGSGSFGVRRPLRYLAFKLQLSEAQVTGLAAILDELKLARAQAAVDYRRTVSAFADAVSEAELDPAKLEAIRLQRVQSAERVQVAVLRALSAMHALLGEPQRQKLAYLLRTGALAI